MDELILGLIDLFIFYTIVFISYILLFIYFFFIWYSDFLRDYWKNSCECDIQNQCFVKHGKLIFCLINIYFTVFIFYFLYLFSVYSILFCFIFTRLLEGLL